MRKLIDAYRGAIIRARRFSKKQTLFLILTDDDAELNYYALGHAVEYADANGYTAVELICENTMSENIRKLNENAFPLHTLKKDELDFLLSYLILKSNSLGALLLPNYRIVSLGMNNEAFSAMYRYHIFDKEYLLWYRLYYRMPGANNELKRMTPFWENKKFNTER
ncbi:MAG: hypothetical protein J6A07_09340 [Firmicutes bacterium]|nr:hypothetical protein [Bacillota bacterium]